MFNIQLRRGDYEGYLENFARLGDLIGVPRYRAAAEAGQAAFAEGSDEALAWDIARHHAMVGNVEEALRFLLERREEYLMTILMDTAFDPIRDHPEVRSCIFPCRATRWRRTLSRSTASSESLRLPRHRDMQRCWGWRRGRRRGTRRPQRTLLPTTIQSAAKGSSYASIFHCLADRSGRGLSDLDFPGLPLALCPACRCRRGKWCCVAWSRLGTPRLSRRVGGQALCKGQALAWDFDPCPFRLISPFSPALVYAADADAIMRHRRCQCQPDG